MKHLQANLSTLFKQEIPYTFNSNHFKKPKVYKYNKIDIKSNKTPYCKIYYFFKGIIMSSNTSLEKYLQAKTFSFKSKSNIDKRFEIIFNVNNSYRTRKDAKLSLAYNSPYLLKKHVLQDIKNKYPEVFI